MNRIGELCKVKDITYVELGKQAGVSSMYVGMLVNGKRKNPSLEVMQKISNALGEKVEKVFKINVSINKEIC